VHRIPGIKIAAECLDSASSLIHVRRRQFSKIRKRATDRSQLIFTFRAIEMSTTRHDGTIMPAIHVHLRADEIRPASASHASPTRAQSRRKIRAPAGTGGFDSPLRPTDTP